jgi:3-hydroxyisobutyrate dehydrogenase-like beta-hydroxyacid dehydrogenase
MTKYGYTVSGLYIPDAVRKGILGRQDPEVLAYEVQEALGYINARLNAKGGRTAIELREASQKADVLCTLLWDASQAQALLEKPNSPLRTGLLKAMSDNA